MYDAITSIGEVGPRRKGCRPADLYGLLKVDGKHGLPENEVNAKGLQICAVPGGPEGACLEPERQVYTEVHVRCPFLFNIWRSNGKDNWFRPGENKRRHKRMIARCNLDGIEPEWCFTDYCEQKPLNCFSTKAAAEIERPWEREGQGQTTGEENQVERLRKEKSNGKLSPSSTSEQHHLSASALIGRAEGEHVSSATANHPERLDKDHTNNVPQLGTRGPGEGADPGRRTGSMDEVPIDNNSTEMQDDLEAGAHHNNGAGRQSSLSQVSSGAGAGCSGLGCARQAAHRHARAAGKKALQVLQTAIVVGN